MQLKLDESRSSRSSFNQKSFNAGEMGREGERRYSLRHNSYASSLSRPLAVLALDERHAFTKPLLLATYGVIYWRDICRRVVIETTHLRGAKWPLPALPESGAINFASPLARPASNLTGWSSLLSLARGNRRAGRLTVARF